jgi:hydroxyacylglutathione hydrolase
MRIEIIPSPGHTAGGVSLRIGGMLFTGDNLLGRRIGRSDLPGGNAAALKASIKELFRLPRDTMLYPGHGRPCSLAEIAEASPDVAELVA